MYTGNALSRRLITEYGSCSEKYCSAMRWIRIVKPVAPPGYKPPVRTNVLIFKAIKIDAYATIIALFKSFFSHLMLFKSVSSQAFVFVLFYQSPAVPFII